MNILVPHKWLLDHLETDASPKEIQRCLSLCGPSVERIYEREGDSVYDIEITTNRVDSASVRGIAREAAAILSEFGLKAKLKPLNLNTLPTNNPQLDLEIINDPALCHRIIAVKLEKVSLSKSPDWLQQRLKQIDLRPINNAIDITNYVMWDIGHPIHAFDYDKLTTKKILVRQAKRGETLITLDNQIHACKGGEVIFDDGSGTIIDLPGIMGTANTAVTGSTTNVLLWIESVDAVKIRHASLGLSIRSQAAVLNEKQVDPELAPTALNVAASLYKKLTNAHYASNIYDDYPHPQKIISTKLLQSEIDTYLGIEIPPKQIVRILESLECIVVHAKESYLITPPSFRSNDLKIPQDYIEEIARIYGYHNLPSTIMATAIPNHPSTENFDLEHYIKLLLTGWGCQEVYTYSMVSKELALQSGYPEHNHLQIANPLSDEWEYMRRSLVPSLMQVANSNPAKPVIFEAQNVYHPRSGLLPVEELHLTLLATADFEKLKGITDALFQKLFIDNHKIDKSGKISIDKQLIGQISHQDNFYVVDILLHKLITAAKSHPSSISLNLYPPIIEDLTFTLPPQTYIGPVIEQIRSLGPDIVRVELKSIYRQNHTFTITYQSNQKNLSTEDIAPTRKKIVDSLKKLNLHLVGSLSE